jgi:hypothetical protein
MELKDWMQYGWPTVALLFIGLFIYKLGWPFMVKTMEDAQQHSRELTKEFLKALERRDELQRTNNADFIRRFDILINRRPRETPDKPPREVPEKFDYTDPRDRREK